jgi:hypothetical protein
VGNALGVLGSRKSLSLELILLCVCSKLEVWEGRLLHVEVPEKDGTWLEQREDIVGSVCASWAGGRVMGQFEK